MSYPSPSPSPIGTPGFNLGGRDPRWTRFAAGMAVLTLAFAPIWSEWFRLSQAHEIHSYLPLIPFLTAYLAWTQRTSLAVEMEGRESTPSNQPRLSLATLAWFALGATLLIGASVWAARPPPDPTLVLDLRILAYCAGAYGLATLFLGSAWLRKAAFPAGFLLFLIPLPDPVISLMETFFQHTSADAADILIRMAGIPVLRDGLIFQLPHITLQVAPQCSGIRSSWMLILTAVLGGRMLLDRPIHRVLLVLFVIPLGILRNGFRILVLAWLCVEVDPSYIDSPIHHQGGPLFFGLSLIPFALFIWLLRKREARPSNPSPAPDPVASGLSVTRKKASSH